MTRQESVGDRAEGVDVASVIERTVTGHLFRGHVQGGAPNHQLAAHVAWSGDRRDELGRLDQPEIEELGHVVTSAPEAGINVRRLDVAMDQARGVGLGQCATDLLQEPNHPARRHGTMALHKFVKAETAEVFHHVEERAVSGLAVVVDFHGVRMREAGGRANFSRLEPQEGLRVGRAGGTDQLQGAQGRLQ